MKTWINNLRTTVKATACVLLISLASWVQTAHAATETYFYHNDHLGTPQMFTDKNKAVVWQSVQEPFGEITETVNTVEQNLRFPGLYFDRETGLHYNYYRDYDPGIGRYVASDPIGLAGGLNAYAYVGGNPLSYTDTYGLWANVVVGVDVPVWADVPQVSQYHAGYKIPLGVVSGSSYRDCRSVIVLKPLMTPARVPAKEVVSVQLMANILKKIIKNIPSVNVKALKVNIKKDVRGIRKIMVVKKVICAGPIKDSFIYKV